MKGNEPEFLKPCQSRHEISIITTKSIHFSFLISRFKVVVNTVMQIGPSIAIYGGVVFVRHLISRAFLPEKQLLLKTDSEKKKR